MMNQNMFCFQCEQTLLHLGMKNIYLGPTLPAFLSKNVLEFLVKNFDIHPTGTPEEDLANILK